MKKLIEIDPSSPNYADMRGKILAGTMPKAALRCRAASTGAERPISMEFLSNNGGIVIHTYPSGSPDGRLESGANLDKTRFTTAIIWNRDTRREIAVIGKDKAFRLHKYFFELGDKLEPCTFDRMIERKRFQN